MPSDPESHSRSAGTRHRAALAAGLLVCALFALASATAQAASYEIHTGRYGVKSLGPFFAQQTARYKPTLDVATSKFGRPSNVFRVRGGGCRCRTAFQRAQLDEFS